MGFHQRGFRVACCVDQIKCSPCGSEHVSSNTLQSVQDIAERVTDSFMVEYISDNELSLIVEIGSNRKGELLDRIFEVLVDSCDKWSVALVGEELIENYSDKTMSARVERSIRHRICTDRKEKIASAVKDSKIAAEKLGMVEARIFADEIIGIVERFLEGELDREVFDAAVFRLCSTKVDTVIKETQYSLMD